MIQESNFSRSVKTSSLQAMNVRNNKQNMYLAQVIVSVMCYDYYSLMPWPETIICHILNLLGVIREVKPQQYSQNSYHAYKLFNRILLVIRHYFIENRQFCYISSCIQIFLFVKHEYLLHIIVLSYDSFSPQDVPTRYIQ